MGTKENDAQRGARDRAPAEGTKPIRRTRQQMRAETSSALIAVARRHFFEEGYAHASMDRICEAASVTRGALYHNFGGKEGLFEAVFRQLDEEIGKRIDAKYEGIEDPLAALLAACFGYLEAALDPEVQRITLRDGPAVLGQKAREIDEAGAIQPLAEALAELMEAGRLRHTDPEALARMLNGAMMDAAMWIASSDTPDEAFDKAKDVLSALVHGLEA